MCRRIQHGPALGDRRRHVLLDEAPQDLARLDAVLPVLNGTSWLL